MYLRDVTSFFNINSKYYVILNIKGIYKFIQRAGKNF